MDISCQGQQFFGFDHADTFLADCFGGFLQIQFLVHGDQKDIVVVRAPDRHKRLEHLLRVLSENVCNFGAADNAGVCIAVGFVRDLFLVQQPHDVCFFCVLFHGIVHRPVML